MQSGNVPLSAAFMDCTQILTVGYTFSEGGNYVLFLTFNLGPCNTKKTQIITIVESMSFEIQGTFLRSFQSPQCIVSGVHYPAEMNQYLFSPHIAIFQYVLPFCIYFILCIV